MAHLIGGAYGSTGGGSASGGLIGGGHLTASLSDVCDVRYEPITEAEAWAILYQGSKMLNEVFINGTGWEGRSPAFLITPDTVQLTPEGTVDIAQSMKTMSQAATNFLPPEVIMGQTPHLNKQLEAMHVFSLGAVVFWALTFKEMKRKEDLTPSIKSVLSNMLQKVPALRSSLQDILEASTQEVGNLGGAPQPFIRKMVEFLLGTDGKQSNDSHVPDILKYFPTIENAQPVSKSAFQPVSLPPGGDSQYRSPSAGVIHKPTPSKPSPAFNPYNPQEQQPGYATIPAPAPAPAPAPQPPIQHQPKQNMYKPPMEQNPPQYQAQPYGNQPGYPYEQQMPASMPQRNPSGPMSLPNRPRSLPGPRNPYEQNPNPYDEHPMMQPAYQSYPVDPRMNSKPGAHEEHWNSTENLLDGPEEAYLPQPQQGFPPQQSYQSLPPRQLHSRATSTSDFDRYLSTLKPNNSKAFKPIQEEMAPQPAYMNPPPPNDNVKAQPEPFQQDPAKASPSIKPKGSKAKQKKNTFKNSSQKSGGPEFLYWNSQKPENIEIPFQSTFTDGSDNMTGNNVNKRRQVLVELPNGRKLDVKCEVYTTVQDIFDATVTHLTLIEHSFFGLTYYSDDEYYFLEFPDKLCDVAPDSWRHGMTSSFTLYFQVKFYAPDIGHLKHALTRHYFYLQLRKDLLNDKYDCSEDLALILGSLSMQAEYGDTSDQMTKWNYFRADHYVAQSVISYLSHDYVQSTLLTLHRANFGMSSEEAEGKMIMQCCKISDYGRHFYKLFHTHEQQATFPVHLGISTFGLDCWRLDDDDEMFRERLYSFGWGDIVSVQFKKRRFIIEAFDGLAHEYTTDSNKKGKYLLQLCSSHNRFQTAIGTEEEPTQEDMLEQAQGNPQQLQPPSYEVPPRAQNRSPQKPPREKEREINVIRIKKKPGDDDSFGLVLEDASALNPSNPETGVVISRVAPGSSSAQDGRLKPGDKLVAINGLSLEGFNKNEATEKLYEADDLLDLVVSQPVGSPKKIEQPRKQPMGNYTSPEKENETNYLPVYRSNTMPPPQDRSTEGQMYPSNKRRGENTGDRVHEPFEAYLPDFKSEPVNQDSVQPFQTRELMPKPETGKANLSIVSESDLLQATEIASVSDASGPPTAAPRRVAQSGQMRQPGENRRQMRPKTVSSASEEARRDDAMKNWLTPSSINK